LDLNNWASWLSGSLTVQRTASGHNVTFQLMQKPNVAAMRWRGLLGVSLLVIDNTALLPTLPSLL
jgi:hypothetical protein